MYCSFELQLHSHHRDTSSQPCLSLTPFAVPFVFHLVLVHPATHRAKWRSPSDSFEVFLEISAALRHDE